MGTIHGRRNIWHEHFNVLMPFSPNQTLTSSKTKTESRDI